MEESDPFRHLQLLESRLFEIVSEILQVDNASSLLASLHLLLEKWGGVGQMMG